MIYLILGGARSGKSTYAEALAERLAGKGSSSQFAKQPGSVTYIATASAGDSEMRARIARHQSRRPKHWQLIEEQYQLSRQLEKLTAAAGSKGDKTGDRTDPGSVILIDCLTLWLSNWLCRIDSGAAGRESGLSGLDSWNSEKNSFIEELKKSPVPIILVSNEVGSGIVPMGELSRHFVDHAGWLNQSVARVADQVVLVVAGLPQTLKG
ncbi:MAG: bifunctional adenosylcobinamide kinase/adenosylcobinamide-phosphate guanylyltransferase [Proteobacteria bacterium]|nr:MAG: bifunctional adenosylcobinamide kinase/adenosylcobinamide-phosphate guanylyltransferase [Pseudomonadota bacterium]PIE40263.1 MAG: bifunctional adenosylcobinamide kinase/adenosylcobinamide-phosphate guanylyltransferase [Gammaproteobacteria bacterium]